MIDVTVITPSIPRRSYVLSRCIESVRSQEPSWRVMKHFIALDNVHPEFPVGPARLRNQMIKGVDTEWLVFLDDDDTIDHNFFRVLWPFTTEYEVIIPHCRFDGPPIPPQYVNQLSFNREKLREHGQFPITCLVRTELVQNVGGFPEDETYEDWVMWNRIADLHEFEPVEFIIVPEVLWTYRTHIDPNDDRRTAEAMRGER